MWNGKPVGKRRGDQPRTPRRRSSRYGPERLRSPLESARRRALHRGRTVAIAAIAPPLALRTNRSVVLHLPSLAQHLCGRPATVGDAPRRPPSSRRAAVEHDLHVAKVSSVRSWRLLTSDSGTSPSKRAIAPLKLTSGLQRGPRFPFSFRSHVEFDSPHPALRAAGWTVVLSRSPFWFWPAIDEA